MDLSVFWQSMLTFSALFLAVWLIRTAFQKHMSALVQYLLWMVVIAKLIVPVGLPTQASPWNLLSNSAAAPQVLQQSITPTPTFSPIMHETQTATDGTQADQAPAEPAAMQQDVQTTEPAQSPAFQADWKVMAIAGWISGTLAMLFWMLVSAVRIRRQLARNHADAPGWAARLLAECKGELQIKRNIRLTVQRAFPIPAIMGLFKPVLILPAQSVCKEDAEGLRHIILHELTHYKNGDIHVTFLLNILNAVYWFNPLVWLLVRLMRRDMETLCDNRVIARIGKERRQDYIRTVLQFTQAHPVLNAAMSMNDGRIPMKKRIQGMFMRKKTGIRVKIPVLLLSCVMGFVCFTTGCQPTPAVPPVINKAQTDITQQLQQSTASNGQETGQKLSQLDIPKGNYKYTTQNDTGTLKIHVDAPVIVPASGKMPSAKVVPMQFTQQQVKGIFNYLYPDKKPNEQDQTMTKSDIENSILSIKKNIANLKESMAKGETDASAQDIIDQNNSYITKLQEQEKTAPDKKNPPVVSDGTMQYNTQIGCMYLATNIPDSYNMFLAMTSFDGKGIFKSLVDGPAASRITYHNTKSTFTMDKAIRITTQDKLPDKAAAKLKLSLKDAIAKADGLFAAAGIKDVTLFSSYLVDNHGTGHVDNNWDPASEYAYDLYYTRTLQGAPITASADVGTSTDGDYTVPWGQENILVTVGNAGILEFTWGSPNEATDILTDDANMIDFKTAIDRFEKSVLYTYEPLAQSKSDTATKKTLDVSIDEIHLAPIRLRQKDHPNEYAGVYVPAYVFYGQLKLHQEDMINGKKSSYDGYIQTKYTGNDFIPGPTIVFAINAVDGSTINPMENY